MSLCYSEHYCEYYSCCSTLCHYRSQLRVRSESEYGTFTIKLLPHTRHNHDLPTYVAFVDLVKVFDTFDHTLILHILKNYGAPPNLRSSIDRMYQYLKVVLKIGKTKEIMCQTVDVRQEDCMAPVLLLFMVMAFAEKLKNNGQEQV